MSPPSVLVGIIANDSARYSLFASCVHKLDTSGVEANIEWLIGGDWCGARNDLVRMCLNAVVDNSGKPWDSVRHVAQAVLDDNDVRNGREPLDYKSDAEVYAEHARREMPPLVLKPRYTHLWFMDDDHAFPPSLLKRLLRHDLPLVNPICLTRRAPFPPVCYTKKTGPNMYLPIPLSEHAEDSLVELEAGGCAGMLIHRDVLEAVADPWFEYTDRSEDIVFCEKAKAAGFKIHADLTARLGHITTAVVWPAVQDGEWKTGITVGQDMFLTVPLATETDSIP